MTRKHYIPLAHALGVSLAIAIHGDQHENWYNDCYTPLVAMLKADNPNFDQGRFAYAIAEAEQAYRELRDLNYPAGKCLDFGNN